ncbi:ParB N-terminal domain-containing protein [Bradyrhizobium sp. CCBAU 21360]|uniref:ParB N-terminal domain-containing protein n=1 Tax=Bradyrhizobium sp. CCBAU 21360 TaxID=1325081 RepID=UPI0023069507|nr:ParB N-terminal domain-containing protein [Bradyrhizobium sp. CCBAU 21360]
MRDTTKVISSYTVVKLPLSKLRPSEEINVEAGRMLAMTIAEKGQWIRPLLIENRHWVIMDGHHRHFGATLLRLSFVPCVLLSYGDTNLHVTYWSDPAPFPVDRIIQAGLSGNLMSFKTTRHHLRVPLPTCAVDLDDLR